MLNLKEGRYTIKLDKFNTINELVEHNTNNTITELWKDKDISLRIPNEKKFFNCESLEEAYELLNNGWHKEAKKAVIEIKKAVTFKTRLTYYNDIVGYIPNVARYLNNLPNCMINQKRDIKKQKILHIVYDCAVACSVKQQELFNNCINLINIINELQAQNYRVILDVFSGAYDKEQSSIYGMLVNVKKAESPLNIDKLMYPITNVAFLRAIEFDWEDKSKCTSNVSKDFLSSRGKVLYACDKEREFTKEVLSRYYSKGVFINYKDCMQGIDHIKKVLGV